MIRLGSTFIFRDITSPVDCKIQSKSGSLLYQQSESMKLNNIDSMLSFVNMNLLTNYFSSLFGQKTQLTPKSSDVLDGILSLLPREILEIITSMIDLDTIKHISSINLACKAKVGNSVTCITGDFTVDQVIGHKRRFPYLREVFGVITAKNLSLFDLDLSTFTLELPYDILTPRFYESITEKDKLSLVGDQVCEKMARLTHMKNVSVQVWQNAVVLTDPPIPKKNIMEMISWNEGVIDISRQWAYKALKLFPCHAVFIRAPFIPYLAESVKCYPIHTVIMEYGNYMYHDASHILEANDRIESILCSNKQKSIIISRLIRGNITLFCHKSFKTSYPNVHTFQIPVNLEQIPDLMRIFPNLKNATVMILSAYGTDYVPDLTTWSGFIQKRNQRKAKEAIAPFQDQYPGVSFTFF